MGPSAERILARRNVRVGAEGLARRRSPTKPRNMFGDPDAILRSSTKVRTGSVEPPGRYWCSAAASPVDRKNPRTPINYCSIMT
jgi:hypothetical protein